MAEVSETTPDLKHCSNPTCDQLGTKSCSACKTSFYCGVICQKEDWAHHKEECDGHLRKVGVVNLDKTLGFYRQRNWVQALRYGEIAATKLKQLKDRRLETVQLIDRALGCKFNALQRLDRHKEALECIKECYTLWAMNHLRNPGSMRAALSLIQSCLHNKEYEDAERYARHAYFMIAEMTDNIIPSDHRSQFLAEVSYYLAQAIFKLAESRGIPPEEKQKVGEEAIEHARKALELHTQLHGTESSEVAAAMTALADVLDYFNDIVDDEPFRLLEQATAITRRVEGSSSVNVAVGESKLGNVYQNRARRAGAANDMDRCLANLEQALSHYHCAVRAFRACNHMGFAQSALDSIAAIEETTQKIGIVKAAAAAAAVPRG